MSFQILDVESGEFWAVDGEPLVMVDGAGAAMVAAALHEEHGRKFQVRRVVEESVDWRKRERERFESGYYQSPFWACDGSVNITIPADHFLHVSRADSAFVAFTKDSIGGAADRQTRSAVGSYLMRYCNVSEEQALKIQNLHLEVYGLQSQVRFARSADEIESFYIKSGEDLVKSCMTNGADWYSSSCHPVRVYGDSDLALSYMLNQSGRLIARCMVWPDKKIHGRLYGDGDRIARALRALGYSSGDFEGARIRKIECQRTGRWVAPYLDGCRCIRSAGPDFWMITDESDLICTNQNGLAGSNYSCESCGDGMDEDDSISVYTSRRHSESWCQGCVDHSSFIWRGDYYAEGCAVTVDDETVPEWEAESIGFSYCEYREENTFEAVGPVFVFNRYRGQLVEQEWSRSAQDDHAFKCRIDGKVYCDSLMVSDDWIDDSQAFRCRFNYPDDVPENYDGVVDYRCLETLTLEGIAA